MKPLDPVIENDLNAIDAALQEGRPTADDRGTRELQELALLLESDVQAPEPRFAAELGDRVQDGFPRERRFRLPRVRLTRLHAAAGAGLAAVIAVVIGFSVDSGQRASAPRDIGGAPAEQAPRTLPAPAGGGAEFRSRRALGKAAGDVSILPLPPQPGGGNFVPGRDERRIERAASLTLAAPGDELDRMADRVTLVTDRHGGFVLSSQVSSGEDGATGGSFDLRIPVDRLQPAMRDLAALGEVRSRTQSGRDVTSNVVTAADRLQAARAERRSLLTRLENATTDTEAEALRRRLDLNAAEIRALRSRLRDLRLRTGYAAVSVSLVEEGSDSGAGGGSGSLDDALDDALGLLEDSLGIVLRVLGVAIPLGLLAAAAWAAARILRRRRREAALF
jgi:Domain of unknown function (DUF4349)